MIDFENRVLERLNAEKSVESFLSSTVFLLSDAVKLLMDKIFRKDDYAVRYAVDPLFTGEGPLSELHLQLKLIYALGIIERNEYEDAEYLLALYEELAERQNIDIGLKTERAKHEKVFYQFTDNEVVAVCEQLHCVKDKSLLQDSVLQNSALSSSDNLDELSFALQQKRKRQIIKSTLVLSVTNLLSNLANKPAQNISPLKSE